MLNASSALPSVCHWIEPFAHFVTLHHTRTLCLLLKVSESKFSDMKSLKSGIKNGANSIIDGIATSGGDIIGEDFGAMSTVGKGKYHVDVAERDSCQSMYK